MFRWLNHILGNHTEGDAMWLIVGLGNPGDKYKNNRHNIGFMAVDSIADEFSFSPFKKKHKGLVSEGLIDGQKVMLLKPQTFMNESGQAIGEAAKFYKIDPLRIIIFHDELDLHPGKMRVKWGGGHAGHNGLRSTHAHLGTDQYGRVRLGVGHPGDKNRVSGYVLSDFSKAEQSWLGSWIDALTAHIGLLFGGADEEYMTRVAQSFDVKS